MPKEDVGRTTAVSRYHYVSSPKKGLLEVRGSAVLHSKKGKETLAHRQTQSKATKRNDDDDDDDSSVATVKVANTSSSSRKSQIRSNNSIPNETPVHHTPALKRNDKSSSKGEHVLKDTTRSAIAADVISLLFQSPKDVTKDIHPLTRHVLQSKQSEKQHDTLDDDMAAASDVFDGLSDAASSVFSHIIDMNLSASLTKSRELHSELVGPNDNINKDIAMRRKARLSSRIVDCSHHGDDDDDDDDMDTCWSHRRIHEDTPFDEEPLTVSTTMIHPMSPVTKSSSPSLNDTSSISLKSEKSTPKVATPTVVHEESMTTTTTTIVSTSHLHHSSSPSVNDTSSKVLNSEKYSPKPAVPTAVHKKSKIRSTTPLSSVLKSENSTPTRSAEATVQNLCSPSSSINSTKIHDYVKTAPSSLTNINFPDLEEEVVETSVSTQTQNSQPLASLVSTVEASEDGLKGKQDNGIEQSHSISLNPSQESTVSSKAHLQRNVRPLKTVPLKTEDNIPPQASPLLQPLSPKSIVSSSSPSPIVQKSLSNVGMDSSTTMESKLRVKTSILEKYPAGTGVAKVGNNAAKKEKLSPKPKEDLFETSVTTLTENSPPSVSLASTVEQSGVLPLDGLKKLPPKSGEPAQDASDTQSISLKRIQTSIQIPPLNEDKASPTTQSQSPKTIVNSSSPLHNTIPRSLSRGDVRSNEEIASNPLAKVPALHSVTSGLARAGKMKRENRESNIRPDKTVTCSLNERTPRSTSTAEVKTSNGIVPNNLLTLNDKNSNRAYLSQPLTSIRNTGNTSHEEDKIDSTRKEVSSPQSSDRGIEPAMGLVMAAKLKFEAKQSLKRPEKIVNSVLSGHRSRLLSQEKEQNQSDPQSSVSSQLRSQRMQESEIKLTETAKPSTVQVPKAQTQQQLVETFYRASLSPNSSTHLGNSSTPTKQSLSRDRETTGLGISGLFDTSWLTNCSATGASPWTKMVEAPSPQNMPNQHAPHVPHVPHAKVVRSSTGASNISAVDAANANKKAIGTTAPKSDTINALADDLTVFTLETIGASSLEATCGDDDPHPSSHLMPGTGLSQSLIVQLKKKLSYSIDWPAVGTSNIASQSSESEEPEKDQSAKPFKDDSLFRWISAVSSLYEAKRLSQTMTSHDVFSFPSKFYSSSSPKAAKDFPFRSDPSSQLVFQHSTVLLLYYHGTDANQIDTYSIVRKIWKRYFIDSNYSDEITKCYEQIVEKENYPYRLSVTERVVTVIYNIVGLLASNNLQGAIEFYHRFLKELIQYGIKQDGPITAYSYHNLGVLYLLAKRADVAQKYFFDALNIQMRHVQGPSVEKLSLLNEIGVTFLLTGQYSKALGSFDEALALTTSVSTDASRLIYSTLWSNKAAAFYLMNDEGNCIDALDKVIEFYRDTVSSAAVMESSSLTDLEYLIKAIDDALRNAEFVYNHFNIASDNLKEISLILEQVLN